MNNAVAVYLIQRIEWDPSRFQGYSAAEVEVLRMGFMSALDDAYQTLTRTEVTDDLLIRIHDEQVEADELAVAAMLDAHERERASAYDGHGW